MGNWGLSGRWGTGRGGCWELAYIELLWVELVTILFLSEMLGIDRKFQDVTLDL